MKKGLIVGKIKIMLNGKKLAETELITLNSVDEGSFFKKLQDSIKESFKGV